LPALRQNYLVAVATSLDKLEIKVSDPSSARKALSYGEKIGKIKKCFNKIELNCAFKSGD